MIENRKERDPKERDPKTGLLLPGHELRKTSGAWLFLKSGRVPSVRGKRRIQRELSALREKLMQAVPGSDDVRKQVLIGQIIRCEGFCLLIESFLKRFGVLDPQALSQGQVQVQGSLTALVSFMNSQARAVASLGMDKREAADVLNLGKYISEFDAAKAKAESQGQGQDVNAQPGSTSCEIQGDGKAKE